MDAPSGGIMYCNVLGKLRTGQLTVGQQGVMYITYVIHNI